jgi:hypothetical protein
VNDVRRRIADHYAVLNNQQQTVLLARLADRLTLVGRSTYGMTDNIKLRAVNEAQNRILAQLLRLLMGNESRYPDDIFANILVDQFEILELDPETIIDCQTGA